MHTFAPEMGQHPPSEERYDYYQKKDHGTPRPLGDGVPTVRLLCCQRIRERLAAQLHHMQLRQGGKEGNAMIPDYYIIKNERFAQGYTQQELARKAQISVLTLRKAERGGSITPTTNRKIKAALGLK